MYQYLSATVILIISLTASANTESENVTPSGAAEATTQFHQESLRLLSQPTADGKWARASASHYNADPASIQALYGTWQITVALPQPRIDTLQVDTTYTGQEVGYYGWDTKHNVGCYYEPNMFGSIYSYQCLYVVNSVTGISQRYLFNINGNTLTGKYHSGTSADFLSKLNANQLINLSGTNPAKSSDPSYSDRTGELMIPKVSVNGKNYSVIMQRQSNGQFSVKIANPL